MLLIVGAGVVIVVSVVKLFVVVSGALLSVTVTKVSVGIREGIVKEIEGIPETRDVFVGTPDGALSVVPVVEELRRSRVTSVFKSEEEDGTILIEVEPIVVIVVDAVMAEVTFLIVVKGKELVMVVPGLSVLGVVV